MRLTGRGGTWCSWCALCEESCAGLMTAPFGCAFPRLSFESGSSPPTVLHSVLPHSVLISSPLLLFSYVLKY